jgi:hypothetical protein
MYSIMQAAIRDGIRVAGDAITFAGSSGDISTYAVIKRDVGITISAVTISAPRLVATLIVDDIGSPSRGDTITRTADGMSWSIQELVEPTNEHMQTWTIEPV